MKSRNSTGCNNDTINLTTFTPLRSGPKACCHPLLRATSSTCAYNFMKRNRWPIGPVSKRTLRRICSCISLTLGPALCSARASSSSRYRIRTLSGRLSGVYPLKSASSAHHTLRWLGLTASRNLILPTPEPEVFRTYCLHDRRNATMSALRTSLRTGAFSTEKTLGRPVA